MKKRSKILTFALCMLLITASVLSLCGCGKASGGYEKNKTLDTSEEIVLRIASAYESWPEMDAVIAKFEEIYPNCSIVCEWVENYADNISTRLASPEQKVDVFKTANIQRTTPYKDQALNLISEESKKILDLSGTNAGIVENFKYVGEENTQYAIPFGGEMRGMYVNVTLLNKFNLAVPKNRSELMKCCEVLYENGYIPFQSSNGTFAQQLLYPYICNSIVNGGSYEETYAAIENIEPGVSEYFRDAYTFLYEIVSKGYYDYKRVENELGYSFAGSDGKAKEFLNIMQVAEDTYEKQDDIGKIAFLPDTQAFELYLSKTKSDYHSEIEYQFILSPVGADGGYAYLSPADGLAVNKASDHPEWALEFLNFFFTPEISTAFAEESGKIPNTKDALLKFDVPENRSCDVGKVTFSYTFYKTVTSLMCSGYDDMIGISKMNAQKYMLANPDGTYTIQYSLEDYMERLESDFQKIKAEREATAQQ